VAIIVDAATRLVVQGITGREGTFHATRNKDYGTNVVAGVTPAKGGQEVAGVPVFDTVREAVAETSPNTAMVFVPARFAADAIYEAVDAGIATIICITEGIPAHDMLRVYNYIRPRGVTMIGPNCPGVLSPGKANVGIIPAEIFQEGGVGLVSRSGTLTYQIGHDLAHLGIGQSTIVGIGGDPVVGSSFLAVLPRFGVARTAGDGATLECRPGRTRCRENTISIAHDELGVRPDIHDRHEAGLVREIDRQHARGRIGADVSADDRGAGRVRRRLRHRPGQRNAARPRGTPVAQMRPDQNLSQVRVGDGRRPARPVPPPACPIRRPRGGDRREQHADDIQRDAVRAEREDDHRRLRDE